MQRRAGAFAIAVVVALAAVACRGGSDGTVPPGTVARRAGDEVRRGGVLRLGVERPASFDPALARTVPQSDLVVADLLFDGLTGFDPETGNAVPALAASWEASDDVRRWTFRLDPSSTFGDGSPVTSEDVRFTLERARQLGDKSEAAVFLEVVEGIDAVGSAVRIRLREPLATLPLALSNPLLGVVPKAHASNPEFGARPVSSGPFMITEASDTLVRLQRSPGSDALLEGVELHIKETVDASYDGFVADGLDWSLVPSSAVNAALDAGHGHVSPYQAVLFYGINLRNPVFADRRFREAIVHAVDRAAIAQQVYGRSMTPRAGIAAAGLQGLLKDPCGELCSHDPDRARDLVDETFGDRPVHTVHVDFDAGGRQDQVAQLIVDALRAAGIPAEVRPRSFEEYKTFVVSGEQAVFRLGWTGGYPSAEAYLAPLFHSGAPDNVVGLSVKEIDTALDAARTEVDPERRRKLLADAERLVMERLPVLPIGQFQTAWATSGRVRDLAVSVSGSFDGAKVWLAAES